MCLAIPGLITSINEADVLNRSGVVNFGGVNREINLSCLPEVKVGDYIIAHAGVALQALDEAEAQKIISDLASIELQE